VRALTEAGVACVVANSFSKNFSLYGERCGGLSVVCASADEAQRVLGQLTATIRSNYSNPPTHGARAISTVLRNAALTSLWDSEVGEMRERILTMRRAIFEQLKDAAGGNDLKRYVDQRGMFTYTGLSASQVDRCAPTTGDLPRGQCHRGELMCARPSARTNSA
jgi:aromatic-amino-acid transaminase